MGRVMSGIGTSLPFATAHVAAAFEPDADIEQTLLDWCY
jgi:hypothetical protein